MEKGSKQKSVYIIDIGDGTLRAVASLEMAKKLSRALTAKYMLPNVPLISEYVPKQLFTVYRKSGPMGGVIMPLEENPFRKVRRPKKGTRDRKTGRKLTSEEISQAKITGYIEYLKRERNRKFGVVNEPRVQFTNNSDFVNEMGELFSHRLTELLKKVKEEEVRETFCVNREKMKMWKGGVRPFFAKQFECFEKMEDIAKKHNLEGFEVPVLSKMERALRKIKESEVIMIAATFEKPGGSTLALFCCCTEDEEEDTLYDGFTISKRSILCLREDSDSVTRQVKNAAKGGKLKFLHISRRGVKIVEEWGKR